MPTGTAVLDFGAFPGSPEASVSVTGQGAIVTASLAEAWIRPQDDTPEHTVDEHVIEALKIVAGPIVAGAGFLIRGECTNGRAYGRFNVNWVWA